MSAPTGMVDFNLKVSDYFQSGSENRQLEIGRHEHSEVQTTHLPFVGPVSLDFEAKQGAFPSASTQHGPLRGKQVSNLTHRMAHTLVFHELGSSPQHRPVTNAVHAKRSLFNRVSSPGAQSSVLTNTRDCDLKTLRSFWMRPNNAILMVMVITANLEEVLETDLVLVDKGNCLGLGHLLLRRETPAKECSSGL